MSEPVLIHLVQQLLELEVEPGRVLRVDCAWSKVKPVEGDPLDLITALQGAVGSNGTLVMPSMADTDIDKVRQKVLKSLLVTPVASVNQNPNTAHLSPSKPVLIVAGNQELASYS